MDVTELCSMLALQFASGRSSTIFDWKNNFNEDLDQCVLFDCSNLPEDIFAEARRE